MKRTYIIVIFIFFLIYCSISFVNHYFFRTYAFDLGLETNAAFNYAHFHWSHSSLYQPVYQNYLCDHFSLILILISPVIYLFGTYSLLAAQIIFILLGGIGVYKYVFYKTGDLFKANLFLIHFYGFWGIFSALGFDYHNNVIGAMFVPWFFYYFESNKIKHAVICFLLLLISKENMALWGAFIASGLLFTNYRKDINKRKVLISLTVFSMIYFLVVTGFIIPELASAGSGYKHLKYGNLGQNYVEIIQTIINRPRYVFTLFFESPDKAGDNFGVKSELHFLILLSGGYALLRKPQFLWMLIPVYAQKLFHDDSVKWGIGAHYAIEFAPILSIALFEFFQLRADKKSTLWLTVAAVLISLAATFSSLDNQVPQYYDFKQTRFYDPERYHVDFDVKELNSELKKIPDSAKVSASSCLTPHLCLRDFIYQYPVVNDADYILMFLNGNAYPLSMDELNQKIIELQKDSLWGKTYDKNKLLIFKRKPTL